MRIVKWDEFQNLPEGTIYQEIIGGGSLNELMILGEIRRHHGKASDHLEAALTPGWADVNSIGEEGRKHLNLSKDDHVDFFVTPEGFGRDGMFDHDTRSWLIWEQADRERLAGWLLDPEKALMQMNDEPHAHVIIPR